jgi:hypothetical protein
MNVSIYDEMDNGMERAQKRTRAQRFLVEGGAADFPAYS